MIKNRILNIGCSTDMDIGLNLTKMGYENIFRDVDAVWLGLKFSLTSNPFSNRPIHDEGSCMSDLKD